MSTKTGYVLRDSRNFTVYRNSDGSITVERKQTELIFREDESRTRVLDIVCNPDTRRFEHLLAEMFNLGPT